MKRSNSNSLAIALWLFVVDDVTIELAKVSAMPVLSFSVRSFDHSPLIGLANNGAHRERERESITLGPRGVTKDASESRESLPSLQREGSFLLPFSSFSWRESIPIRETQPHFDVD